MFFALLLNIFYAVVGINLFFVFPVVATNDNNMTSGEVLKFSATCSMFAIPLALMGA